jgi:hypothetical protein
MTRTPLPQEIVMAKRKPLLLVLAYFVLVLLAWGAFLALRPIGPRHHIDKQGVGALREGMTEEEVVQVLGVPAGDYASGRRDYSSGPGTFVAKPSRRFVRKDWMSDEVKVCIWFRPDGKALLIDRSWAHNREEGPFALLRRRLRLPW